jgi:hypothetical protein
MRVIVFVSFFLFSVLKFLLVVGCGSQKSTTMNHFGLGVKKFKKLQRASMQIPFSMLALLQLYHLSYPKAEEPK